MSQAALGRAIGVSTTAIWKLVKNEDAQGSKHTHRIAEILGTNPHFLMGESDDPSPAGVADGRAAYRAGGPPEPFGQVRQPSPPSSVDIHELDLAFGMGGGTYMDLPVKSTTHSFSRAWLRNFTDSPFEQLLFARGMGDSMMPTILDADIVLIDTAQQTPRMNDQIWALQMHGLGMIKRLRAGPDGSMKILSDNPAVSDEVAYDGEMQVIGRVVAAVRKL